MKRTWIGTCVAAAAVLAAALWFAGQSRATSAAHEPQAAGSPAQTVTVAEVRTDEIDRLLEVTGTVRAELDAQIGTKVSGRVLRVMAREGDRVRRGQPLVELDARDLDAAMAQASANVRAASAGYDNARAAVTMEDATSRARIANADAGIAQAEAALKAAQARLDLVAAGPRKQEKAQANLAVVQAQANLSLADANLRRMSRLIDVGAISQQQYDIVKTQRDVAKAQYDTAVQSQSISDEGSRSEDIRAAQEGVRQAQGALTQAQSGRREALASAMQVRVRRQEIVAAQAQVGQSKAALRMAGVTRDYATVVAPFDGVVSARQVDPGAIAAPGVPLMRVQGGATRLEAVVPESALHAVGSGTAVPVQLDALRGKAIAGRVVEVAPQGDATSRSFVVKIDLPRDSGARAGMFGRAHLRLGKQQQLLIPQTAVFEREGLQYVYTVDAKNAARLRLVTIGEPAGDRVPVLSGLNVGEHIVIAGREALTDGAAVNAGGR